MTDISASKRESLAAWEPGAVAALAAVAAAASASASGPYPTVGLYASQAGSGGGGPGGQPSHLPSPYSSFSQPIPSSSSSPGPYSQPQGNAPPVASVPLHLKSLNTCFLFQTLSSTCSLFVNKRR